MLDKKAEDVLILDVSAHAIMCDVMVIASGNSSRQITALCDHVIKQAKSHSIAMVGMEGQDVQEWVLIDFNFVVVHIMLPETREYYQLEKLWQPFANQQTIATPDNSSELQM